MQEAALRNSLARCSGPYMYHLVVQVFLPSLILIWLHTEEVQFLLYLNVLRTIL